MGLDDPEFDLDDETLIRAALPSVDVDLLRKQGFMRLDLPIDLLPYQAGGFETPDGKASLFSQALADAGHDPLPDYRAARESPGGELHEKYPLVLLTPKNHTRFLNSSYSKHHGEREGGPFFEMDPADASARGIAEGEVVKIWNDRGELQLPARISQRLRPGVAAIPWGWWGKAANANVLTNDTLTDWGGGVAYFDTLVEAAPLET